MSDGEADAERRPKRQKRESSYKAKAFEKFKQLKSGKSKKYEIEEVENIYETVDEKEYVKTVLARQDDDWIVDDDGSGYVEDGRDIFDDDLDSESIAAATASKNKGVKRKKKAVSENAGKGNLQLMLSKMPNKKKEVEKISDDSMLSEILEEIDEKPSTSNEIKPKAISATSLNKKKAEKEYMKTFALPTRKTNGYGTPVKKNLESNFPKPSLILKDTPNKPQAKTKEKLEITPLELPEKVKTEEVKTEEGKTGEVKTGKVKREEVKTGEVKRDEEAIEVDETQNAFDDDLDMSQIEDFESQDATVVEAAKEDFDGDDINADILAQFMDEQENFEEEMGQTNDEVGEASLGENQEENIFRFYWWDAYEDYFAQPGVVCLFGKTYCNKTKSYVSCCLVIRDIERRLFILPRSYILDELDKETVTPVTHKDLYTEFNNSVMKPLNITGFKSRFVSKKYAFNPEIPAESEYMEVRYSAKGPSVPSNTKGKTFSKIFGCQTSYLETFLLERKIKGPCWLDISGASLVTNPVSWCKYEYQVNKTSQVKITTLENPLPPPPLVVATINMRFALNPKNFANEVVMITCLTHTKYAVDKPPPNPMFQKDFCVFSAPGHIIPPPNIHAAASRFKRTKIQKMDSERALLNYFVNQFHSMDPDLVVGHDLQGYQISILADRLCCHVNRNASKLGRLKTSELSKKLEKKLFVGRLVCDTKISAKEAIRSRAYDLGTLCQTVLGFKENQRVELEMEDIPKMFANLEDLTKLIILTLSDTCHVLKIMYSLNVIPLALQITNIAGNVMSKTLMGGRSERNEFLLLHAFYEKDYIPPDKVFAKKGADGGEGGTKKKAAYSGGLVLEPKVGFYDKLVLLMDFNSLYPSIIQEYNICFTTLPLEVSEENMVLPDKNLPAGILPTEIRKLVESRREVKKLMKGVDKNSDLYMQYNIRQMALKLTANSMYGCLGFSNSRFYAKNLAALVTHKGREILTNTRELVMKLSYEVVYGDTDSIMINTNITDIEQVNKIGNKIKQEVNKLYKQVELDIDGVFKYLLLLKKKKYACVTITRTDDGKFKYEKEYKGLDIVRRDWSQIACEAGKIILDHILSDQSGDERINNIHTHLVKIKEDFEQNRIPSSLLVITKQLTKDPRMYNDKNAQPHVQVALRCNKEHGTHFRAGDTVPYVICDDGSSKQATQRAYHLDELKYNKSLKIDVKYYLSQQIHPVVSRICEPIDGIDAFQIANSLGIDSSSFKRTVVKAAKSSEPELKIEMKFRDVDKFLFKCFDCRQDNEIDGVLRGLVPFLEKCSHCDVRPNDYLPFIQNQLILTIRGYISRYYRNVLICEDPACDNETRRLPMKFAGKYPVCNLCQSGVMYKKYSEYNLYSQLCYFLQMFDLNKAEKKPLLSSEVESGYHTLKETVEKFLNHSGYSIINLTELFSGFTTRDKEMPLKLTGQVSLELGEESEDDS